MIKVTKLNGEMFYVNPYEIEFIEVTPDTIISLKSEKKVLVSENADTVIAKMLDFFRMVNTSTRVIKAPGDFEPGVTEGELYETEG